MQLKTLVAFIAILTAVASTPALERLTLSGKNILYKGEPIQLSGINTIAEINKISESDAENIQNMGFNFVRLLLDIDAELDLDDVEGDGDYLKQATVDNWKTIAHWFTSRGIWVHVEMRSNTYDLPTTELWTVGSPMHTKWIAMWKSLVRNLKDEDYIACWGILAEHSQSKRSDIKNVFQPVMQAIDSLDGTTPFTFGPKLNNIDYYDTAQYTDWYWPEYADRIIYQINHLHPKPYINKDTAKGYDPSTWWYHRTDGQDGEGADNDDAMHKQGTLNHLARGFAWRDYYNAPIYIDQWGCDYTQPGYLDYERDMVEIFLEQGMLPNARWTYYQTNGRGIMTDSLGTLTLQGPMKDFFTSCYVAGQTWAYETAASDPAAADNNITTDAVGSNLPWNIDFRFDSAFAANRIELFAGNLTGAEDPAAVTVYGSNDSTAWTELAQVSGISFAGRRGQYTSPAFTNTTRYRFYRASCTANNGGTATALSNLEFFPAPSYSGSVASVKYHSPGRTVLKAGVLSFPTSAARRIDIFSLSGRTVFSKTIFSNQVTLPDLIDGSGMYTVCVSEAGNVIHTLRFVK